MTVLPNGNFQVAPSEDITFTVKRTDTPCKAGFDCHGWASCDPITNPNPNTTVKTCTAQSTSGANSNCAVSIDFRNDDQGSFDPDDEYTVEITGSEGGSFTSTFDPPPVLNGQNYVFVIQGGA